MRDTHLLFDNYVDTELPNGWTKYTWVGGGSLPQVDRKFLQTDTVFENEAGEKEAARNFYTHKDLQLNQGILESTYNIVKDVDSLSLQKFVKATVKVKAFNKDEIGKVHFLKLTPSDNFWKHVVKELKDKFPNKEIVQYGTKDDLEKAIGKEGEKADVNDVVVDNTLSINKQFVWVELNDLNFTDFLCKVVRVSPHGIFDVEEETLLNLQKKTDAEKREIYTQNKDFFDAIDELYGEDEELFLQLYENGNHYKLYDLNERMKEVATVLCKDKGLDVERVLMLKYVNLYNINDIFLYLSDHYDILKQNYNLENPSNPITDAFDTMGVDRYTHMVDTIIEDGNLDTFFQKSP